MYPIAVDQERLSLRELVPDDAAALMAVYGDPRTTAHLAMEPHDHGQCVRLIESAAERAVEQPRTDYLLGIVSRDTGDLVGSARLRVDEHPHSAQIGFALRPDQWGRGMGAETVRLLLHFGFGVLKLHRVWGVRAPEDTASQLVMLAGGMVAEGRIRHHLPTVGGWRDSIVHSILVTEWAEP
ncbi:GNAT family N-acetyltransferase [Allonocardiopsis opalescens]|uniref:RimJ/RimL family protein N-acetyltransferase n=1 Tax=Allonocardiopsis opalescens TaxID=1144618 RepID=A0A2T0Q889_9ACTN|nr:GNAT family N-acetyltransferase [Allonocardiopsis opalescens]PRY00027.1 RimJ/RimL family protein N-acetyltransferase [Allonocardiopsis opalescens]